MAKDKNTTDPNEILLNQESILTIAYIAGQNDNDNIKHAELNSDIKAGIKKIIFQSNPIIHRGNQSFTIVYKIAST